MVEINSWEPGINLVEENLYLRTLNEFRIEFENNVLFFLNHFRSIKGNKINSVYLESELDYFDKLCCRYHVKKIKLKINPNEENPLIDGTLILIKKIRKAIEYSFLDIADFYYENFDQFLNIKLNKNISIILKDLLIKYHRKIPMKIKNAPREKYLGKKKNFDKTLGNFEDNLILREFSKNIKISIDKMFLKVYDYLIETSLKEINSHKMYFLKKDFEVLGKKYFKQKYSVKINNKKPKSSANKCLDEIAANLNRVKEIFLS